MSTTEFRTYIGNKSISEFSKRIKSNYKKFDAAGFCKKSLHEIDSLSLSERISLVRNNLHDFLPKNFEKSAKILVDSLGDPLDDKVSDPVAKAYDSNCGFIVVPQTLYIAKYGLEHFDISMNALNEMTKRFSSEEAMRYFILHNEKKTLAILKKWSKDQNVHVRRLVSECLRPRLPWALQLKSYIKNPEPILPFLEMLKDDRHLYVRRSVANNLNDIAKDHPKVVTDLLEKWNKDNSKEMNWLIRHALRTLEKNGDPKALKILGYSNKAKIKVKKFSVSPKKINFGEAIEINASVLNEDNITHNVVIDYIIHHVKKNGQLSPKTFKWAKKKIKPGQLMDFSKKHSIRPITTRKYYSGIHQIQIQINGKKFEKLNFELRVND